MTDVFDLLADDFEPVKFVAGELVFAQGDPSDSFYIVDDGEMRLEVHTDDVDSDSVLNYAAPGSLVGEVGLLAGTPRSASAYAETDVHARRMTAESLERLYAERPADGLAVARLLGRDAAVKLLGATERVAEHLAVQSADPVVDEMVARAAAAARDYEGWDEARVDAMLRDIAITVAEHAVELGEMTVRETGLGNAADKTNKIQFGALGVYASLAKSPGAGVVADYPDQKLREVLGPVGVVFAMAPVTEPVSTYVNKTLITLKGRNALILSPHRASKSVAAAVDDVVQGVLARHGAPNGLVQLVKERASRQRTGRFMRHPDVAVILATGGTAMVKAAYSSGKPAIGVGTGNAPVWIAPDADLEQAARCVVESKSFDYGLVCGAEQHLVVTEDRVGALAAALEAAGGLVLDAAQSAAAVEVAFTPEGHLRMEHIGRPASAIASALGLKGEAAASARLLVLTASAESASGAYATERLAPIVSLYAVADEDEALSLCRALLAVEGAGHTAVIHSDDEERIDRFAAAMPVSRVLVSVPASQGCGGSLTSLVPSMTLGCGTYGGTSTTDNVGYRNLVNVKRVAGMHFANLLGMRRLLPKAKK
jgi:acyl-CoA reductase-like NAD-dependent aldehyde dehydrogenase